jgi:AcrR family transcriptional regulator
MGLREQKRQLTREAIADAALALALDVGLEHVTVEAIAREVFISPRTVSNYFSCKEEAVVAGGLSDSYQIVDDFSRRPVEESPLHSVQAVLVEIARGRSVEQQRVALQKIDLVRSYPLLASFVAAQYAQLEERLREAIAARQGADRDDVSPWLTAAAAVSAIRYAEASWVEAGGRAEDMPELLQRAFERVEGALSQ